MIYNRKYNISEEYLRKELLENLKTKAEVAREVGCSSSLIGLKTKEYKIEKKSLVGLKIKKFTVIKELSDDEKHKQDVGKNRMWLCQCDCGNFRTLSTKDINCKKYKSCGCNRYLLRKERNTYKGYGEIHGKVWYSIKNGAKKRGWDFKIDIQYAWNLFLKQGGKCALTGLDINFTDKIRDLKQATASLDRINNNYGYIDGNVHWVHKTINMMKQKYSIEEFIKMCELVHKHSMEKK